MALCEKDCFAGVLYSLGVCHQNAQGRNDTIIAIGQGYGVTLGQHYIDGSRSSFLDMNGSIPESCLVISLQITLFRT